MRVLKRINETLSDIFLWIGCLALVLMTGIACVNMVLRIVGSPIAGAYDLVCYLGALVAGLPLAYTQLKKGHIAVDIVSLHFPVSLRKTVVGIGYVTGLIFFGAAGWKIASLGTILRRAGEVSETLLLPFWPFVYAVAASCALMVLCLLLDLLELVASSSGGEK
jgi:TRAP-type C4-dicarboxylate transport system permease small subunit